MRVGSENIIKVLCLVVNRDSLTCNPVDELQLCRLSSTWINEIVGAQSIVGRSQQEYLLPWGKLL